MLTRAPQITVPSERHGFGVSFAGVLMQANPANIALNEWAAQRLDLQPYDDVLDVGCGPGVGLSACLRRTQGCVVGLDPAPRMIQQALTRHRRAINEGRLHLYSAPFTIAAFGLDERFHKILAVNVVQYLDDGYSGGWVAAQLMRSRLKAGGQLAVVFAEEDQHTSMRAAQIHTWLSLNGFSGIRHERFGYGPFAPHGLFARAS